MLGGGLWEVVSATLPQLYTLAISIVAARSLGADGLGRQSFISFVELTAIAVLSAGLPIALMRTIGELVGRGERDAVRSLVAWAWRIELAAALVGFAILAGAGLAGADPRAAWFFAAVAALAGILDTVPSALLIGLQRWRQASIAGLVTGGASTLAAVVVLRLGGGITGMFAVEALTSIVAVAWTSALARRAIGGLDPAASPRPLDPALRRRTVGLALFASGSVLLGVIVWRRSEFLFLAHYSTDAEIAFYSVAFALVTAVVRLPGTIGNVLAPAVANLYGAGAFDRIRSGFARALRLSVFATLPLLAGTVALGPRALTVIWGDEFEAAAEPLVVMAVASIAVPLWILSVALLVGLGRLRVPLVCDALAAAVNIGLAFALVPRHGALGAALANSGAQVVSAASALAYARHVLGSVQWRPLQLAPVAAVTAVAALAAWGVVSTVGGALGLVLGSAAGVAVFTVLGAAVRVLPAEDAAWLGEEAGDRLGGLVGAASRRFGRY